MLEGNHFNSLNKEKLTGDVIASFVSFFRWITIQFSIFVNFWKSGITSLISDIAINCKQKNSLFKPTVVHIFGVFCLLKYHCQILL